MINDSLDLAPYRDVLARAVRREVECFVDHGVAAVVQACILTPWPRVSWR